MSLYVRLLVFPQSSEEVVGDHLPEYDPFAASKQPSHLVALVPCERA